MPSKIKGFKGFGLQNFAFCGRLMQPIRNQKIGYHRHKIGYSLKSKYVIVLQPKIKINILLIFYLIFWDLIPIINMNDLPLNKVKEIIESIKKFGEIGIEIHCQKRMSQRNMTMQDIAYVLNWGKVKKPRYDTKHDTWKYNVEGPTIDGKKIRLVIALIDKFTLSCITLHRR